MAGEHLVARGYAIVDRNFRTSHGEIDLVAANERFLVFCEVKSRIVEGPSAAYVPLASVGRSKRRRVREMAGRWLAERAAPGGRRPPEIRFDAIGITLGGDGGLLALDHVEDAF